MIASHDSLTYDVPTNKLLNIISIFWKTQELDLEHQYELGVRIFDIRVKYYKGNWHGAHGIYVAKNISFKNISDICKYFKKTYHDAIIRIYLEDKNKDIIDIYLTECKIALISYKDMIWEIGIHYPWTTYFTNDNMPFKEIKEYYCHLFNWNPDRSIWHNIKNFDWSSWNIKLYSKKHNTVLTNEIKNDNIMHIMDYVGIYPEKEEN